MTGPVRLGLAGTGAIGRAHLAAIRHCPETVLAAIADPAPAASGIAAQAGCRWYSGLREMLDGEDLDGVILALPTQIHCDAALACIAANLPTFVEKPLAATAAEGLRLVTAARDRGVPLLTGHHRRHSAVTGLARDIIERGDLGRVTVVQGQTRLRKPDSYFAPEWRRAKGAGPVLTNLVHDIDLLQFLCGPITAVQAMETNAARGGAIEDGAVVLLEFDNGALGTLSVSDASAAPWSWEMTAHEDGAYPATQENCYCIGGTDGSLALPSLRLWRHGRAGAWHDPIEATQFPCRFENPLLRQMRHFAAVIRDGVSPLASGADGLRVLQVAEAIRAAAETGRRTPVAPV